MPEENESGFKRSGRLFAALAVLRHLASADAELLGPDDCGPKDNVLDRIRRTKYYEHYSYGELVRLRGKGGQTWEAAKEVFRVVPDLLHPGVLPPGTFSDRDLAQHRAGYDAQMAEYRKKWPKLFG
ncbi:hypothetical protein ACIRUL_23560 [Streptomyces sp. NPDC101171]|uniref:hypothetical protein n=1 Tax=Streptomyces sp. NPDC101171 TaxID=3366122 RepID=UPI0038216272